MHTASYMMAFQVSPNPGLGALNWLLILLAVGIVFFVWRSARKRRAKTIVAPHRPQKESAKRQPSRSPTLSAIFISYRRHDSAQVTGRIYDRLVQHYGRGSVYKDVDSIPLGIDFEQHLDQAVGRCSAFLAVIGEEWAGRLEEPHDYVRIEVEAALQRNIPVIPLLVEEGMMPAEAALPPSLKKLVYRNGMAIRPDPDFHNDMERLIAALDTHLGNR